MQTNASKQLIRLCAVAAFVAVGSAHGAAVPQDTTGAIENFDILGVKLGMTEAQAAAAIKQRFPSAKSSDLTLTNPASHNPVRSGLLYTFDARPKENYNFVKIYIANGKVWAIWRNDLAGSYPYEATSADMTTKYAGASAINGGFDIVGNDRAVGPTGIKGYELYKGSTCDGNNLPFTRVNTSDSIRLNGGCSQVFRVNYGGYVMGGAKLLRNGNAQLVDLEAGRAFLAHMSGDAPPPTTRANL